LGWLALIYCCANRWWLVDRFTLATVMQTGIAIPCLVLLVVKPPHVTEFTGTVYLLLLCSISLAIALQMLNVKALQYLEASVFAVLYNLRIIFATVLGID
jgi:drug/metabolite transporter (DMT)-like permease